MSWIPFYRCRVCRSLRVNYVTKQLSQGWTTENHDLCFVVIPRHKTLELIFFSKFHISPISIINGPWRREIICKYCNSKQTGGGLLGEHGVLSTELLGINVIVGLCFWNLSEGTFFPLRIFNSTKTRCLSHDYFHEWEQSKILKQGIYCTRREDETLLSNKKFISIQDWLSKYWSQWEYQLILTEEKKKTGKEKLLDFDKFGKMSCFNFCKKKRKYKVQPSGTIAHVPPHKQVEWVWFWFKFIL